MFRGEKHHMRPLNTVSLAMTFACTAAGLLLFAAPSNAFAQPSDSVDELRTPQSSQSNVGPQSPIGPSLRTPEAQRRIERLMNSNPPAGELVSATNSVDSYANQSTTQSTTSPEKYGFPLPSAFEGAPKAFVSLGNSLPAYGIVVEKLHHRLTVFKLNDNKTYEVVKTFRAITGKDPGDKLTRGDLRTPEGIYFVTGRLANEALPAKYGQLAFTLDYPNIYDQRQRKSGYGIWIHATDDEARLQKPFDTEGCVVVSNADILELQKYIVSFEIPVVITKEMTTVSPKELEEPRQKALEMVEAWRTSWEKSEFDEYMGFYSKNFRSHGKSKQQWEAFKKNLSEQRDGDIRVIITEPKILAFEDQLLVVFHQDYDSKTHSDYGRKFLYLQWEGDRYRIIAEKWYRGKKTETALKAIGRINNKM